MTFVRSSLKDSGQRWMWSPLNSEGAEGLRKFFLHPTEEVGIGEDRALLRVGGQIGLGTFRACVGLSLSRTSCKSLWVASF